MRWFRSRKTIALLFFLITLGQAYPMSYAWGMGREGECTCQRSGHDCIHGCPRHSEGHARAHAAGDYGKIERSEGQNEAAGLYRLPCGGRSQRELLSFQGDPFLPSQISHEVLPALDFKNWLPPLRLISSIFSPEPPPPRI